MVSLQQESLWYHYEPLKPPVSLYVPTYADAAVSSYDVSQTTIVTPSEGDPAVEEVLMRLLPNAWVKAYLTFARRFAATDRYTLFIPMLCPSMHTSRHLAAKGGFAFDDRERRVAASTWTEEMLLAGMCPFRLTAEQLSDRQTTIDTLNQTMYMDEQGYINQSQAKVDTVIAFEHATIFFVTSEWYDL